MKHERLSLYPQISTVKQTYPALPGVEFSILSSLAF
jgi:hypothetical protein